MMNEAQIKTAAKKVAHRAQFLRNKGRHAEADRMVREAMENVEQMRRAGMVVR